MKESFLHHIWQMQYFNKQNLQTNLHEPVMIFNPGSYNTDSGPDFSNARIRIGSVEWVGSVEIHTLSSEWINHRHDEDEAYRNVILHVVWKMDKPIYRSDQSLLPTIELRGLVAEELILLYRQLVNSSFSIPCKNSFPLVSPIARTMMMEKTMIARLDRKAQEIIHLLDKNGGNWEEVFYQMLCKSFGFKVNAAPFYQLAKALPIRIIQKHRDRPEVVEALMFGQAGFLESKKGDAYYLSLRKEYQYLAKKYAIEKDKLPKAQWKFLRLRPANFPTLRIAQLSAVLGCKGSLFSNVLEVKVKGDLSSFFSVPPSAYWQLHYQFSKKVNSSAHELGQSSLDSLMINLIVPFWAAYARRMDREEYMDRALNLLHQIAPENNKIIRLWTELGQAPDTAWQSQALIELFNSFCQQKNCLNCNIGAALVRPT